MPAFLRSRTVAPLALLLFLVGAGLYAFLSRPVPSSAAVLPLPGSTASAAERPRTLDDLWPGTGPWAEEQLAALTLEQKVAQMFSVYAYGHFASADSPAYQRLVDRVERFQAGGVIFFQGDPMEQAKLVNELQARSAVPLLISQDMEWGAGMRVEGATSFPRPMAIGASRDPRLARSVGYVTAREARALGTHHVFAPVADVNNNPDNPIINVRSYGEAPGLVAEMVAASVGGLQEGGVLATAKHFPGHGDTATDSHLDLPVLPFARERLESVELVPFRAALDAGVMSVMTGHLALPQMEPDSTVPATLSPNVVRTLLRGELDFKGLVVTDAMNMQGVTNNFSAGEAAVRAIEAGTDIVLMSEDVYSARTAVLRAIEEGRLTEARIDASVRRILRAKEWLGLDQTRAVDLDALRQRVATRGHLALSHIIASQSLTLLRNEGGLLPLLPAAQDDEAPRRVLSVTLSDDTDDEADAYFNRQLRRHLPDSLLTTFALARTAPDTAYAAALALADSADVVLVPAFLNVRAWSGQIDLSDEHRAFVNDLTATKTPAVLLAFGNPYLARGLAQQPAAYIAAYGSTPASQRAAAAALFGKSGFHGRLPVTIPGAYAFGNGLMHEQIVPSIDFPETAGMRSAALLRLDSLLRGAVEERAFPGASVAVGRGQTIAKLDGYGYFTYAARQPVTPQSVFDVASLTKVIVTTTAAMQLYEAGRLDLDAPVVRYLPAFGQNAKGDVTIRQLLTHSAGFKAFRPFYQDDRIVSQDTSAWRQLVVDQIMAERLQYEPGTKSEYSDFGFITLGLVVEALTGQSLAAYAEANIFQPLGMANTGFRPIGRSDSTVVPTERDDAFRKRLVQGEVHDETAYLMGGTAGHAGLFTTAEDLATFASVLANGGRIYGTQFLQPETIRLFTTRAEGLGGTRALGWDTRSEEGYSSAGQHFGAQSFGHTGFTGTSLWIDPEANLFVVLLTNRVYPTRENRGHIAIRPLVADLAYEAVVGPPAPLLPGVRN